MDVAGMLDIALTAVAIVLALAALHAVRVFVTAARNLAAAVEEMRAALVPLIAKTDVTVDAINAELLRIDAIVSQAEEVGEAVSSASDFIRSPVNTAAQKLAQLARAIRNR
ncbi:MAG: hypothetical protein ACYC6J_06490 [Coriobacteriia bacterium]